jgi:hypothetical protein
VRVTIDRKTTQLMYLPERFFPAMRAAPRIFEALLFPFYVNSEGVGTVWVVAHKEERKFDAEMHASLKCSRASLRPHIHSNNAMRSS